jgi:hypothetical protein
LVGALPGGEVRVVKTLAVGSSLIEQDSGADYIREHRRILHLPLEYPFLADNPAGVFFW